MKQLFSLLILVFVGGICSNTFAQEVKINHDGTDGFAIETDGTLRVDGAATTWEDLRVPLSSAKKKLATDFSGIPQGTSSGPQLHWFNQTGIDEVYFVAQMPHSYKEGSDIYPHIHWIPNSTKTGNVRWGLEYSWVNRGEAISTTTIYIESSGSLTALEHTITSFAPIDGSPGAVDKTISSMLVCRFFRDGSHALDTYGDFAGGLEFDIHFEQDTQGSREEFYKENQ